MPDWKRFWRSLVATLSRDLREGLAPAPEPASSPAETGERAAAPVEAAEPVAPATLEGSREVQLEGEVRALRDEIRGLRTSLASERASRARLEDEMRAVSDQDALTGLASGRRFADRLTVAIVHARRHKHKLAVVQLGLDRFTSVNQRLGRSHGDDLLRSVALALESTLRQGDTIARAAGDVFTLLLPGIKRDEDVTVIADKLRLALRSPFSIGGHDLLVTASLGMALFPDDGPD